MDVDERALEGGSFGRGSRQGDQGSSSDMATVTAPAFAAVKDVAPIRLEFDDNSMRMPTIPSRVENIDILQSLTLSFSTPAALRCGRGVSPQS